MKRTLSFILGVISLAMMVILPTFSVSAEENNGLKFFISDDETYYAVGYYGYTEGPALTEVSIPAEYKGLPVIEI